MDDLGDLQMALLACDVEAGAAIVSGLVQELALAQIDQDPDYLDLVVLTGKVEAGHITWRF